MKKAPLLRWPLLTLLLSPNPSEGQHNRALAFTTAVAVLASGDTLQGVLAFYPRQNLIRLTKRDKTMVTLAAGRVRTFVVRGEQIILASGLGAHYGLARNQTIADSSAPYVGQTLGFQGSHYQELPQLLPGQTGDEAATRVFHALAWRGENAQARQVPAFFEQLTAGPWMLLRRPVFRSTADVTLGGMGSASYLITKDQFYLRSAAGKIIRLRRPRKDLLALFPAHAPQIQRYIAVKRLQCKQAGGMVAVMNYINSLSPQPAAP